MNGRGEERERGERSEGRRGRMRRSWDEERRGEESSRTGEGAGEGGGDPIRVNVTLINGAGR